MKKFMKTAGIAAFAVIFLVSLSLGLIAGKNQEAEKHPEVDYTLSCVECHTDATPEAVDEWKSSPHGILNYGCYMCHGDGEYEFYASPGSDRCISCHADQDVDFSTSKLDNCFDCHQGHTLKFHKN